MHQPRAVIVQPDDPAIRYIPLTKGQFAIVDAADYEWLMQDKWYARYDPKMKCYYAGRVLRRGEGGDGKKTRLQMHDAILKPRPGHIADHIYGNTLDNRRSQLREATNQQNVRNHRPRSDNTSGIPGVSWEPRRKTWYSHIHVDGKMLNLGRSKDFAVAVAKRKAAEEKYHGEFRRI